MKNISNKEIDSIVKRAIDLSSDAYAPYSNFHVASILMSSDGEEFKGINIENKSFPAGTCAERSAIFSAVIKGKRKFDYIVIASKDAEEPLPPCGECRQVMSEFFDKDTLIVMSNSKGQYIKTKMVDVLPFSLDELKGLKK